MPDGHANGDSSRKPGRYALAFIASTLLLDTIGFGLIIPVMPSLLVELTGRPVNEAALDGGWLGFVYAVMQFFFAPILGNLSDRFGRRPVLLLAIAALGIDYVIMGLAPTLGLLFVGRAIAGMAGASFTPAYAYVADISPPERRAQNFGIVGAMFGMGFILGPALGGLLGGLGPRAPFFAAAGLAAVNLVWGYFALPESLPLERRRPFELRRANPLGTLVQMVKLPVVPWLLFALFLWMLGHQVMPTTWAYYTKFRFGWSEAMIGASLALSGAIMATSQMTMVRFLVPRIGERRAAMTGISVGAIGFIGFALASNGWMMFAWLPTWFLAALVMPTTNGLCSRHVPADAQGELQGAVACLFSVSSILGPPLMTQLFAGFTAADARLHVPGAAFLASATLAMCALAVHLLATGDTPAAPPARAATAAAA